MLKIRAPKRLSSSVFTLALCLTVLSGFAPVHSFNPPDAKTGRIEIAWRHAERAVKTVDSAFKINLPYIPHGAEWMVGVKPVKAGEKEKMYIGVFTWADDKNKSMRGKGFKQLTRMEDYPQELSNVADGYATLNGAINSNETLVIYMEVAPTTQTVFNENGKERSFNASEGSYLIFDGKFERASIEHTGTLISRANSKKIKKELNKHGSVTTNQKFDLRYGVGVPVSASMAGAPGSAQYGCVTESVNESCVGGECGCWSVTTTCGDLSCSSSGGACRESDGVSISWKIPTVCNFNHLAS